jgi:HAMP domain-containing protein
MRMSLAIKFNLVFVLIFALGFAGTGLVAQRALNQVARDETEQTARLIMEAAVATRTYTVDQVRPLLDNQLKYQFLPQSISAYAATETLDILRKGFADYHYREATLNPTNLRDRAEDWEADIVHKLADEPSLAEYGGERDAATGRSVFLARPIKITNEACRECHDTPDRAPKTVLDVYGREHGFGWKLNEIVGAQVVSVPMSVPLQHAHKALETLMISLVAVFVPLLIALNVVIHFFVTRRVKAMAQIAEDVSRGKSDVREFEPGGGDELSLLASSFSRMRASLAAAMKMLEQ